jgi:hypothetical protein
MHFKVKKYFEKQHLPHSGVFGTLGEVVFQSVFFLEMY